MVCSSMTSSSADWVFGEVRLISSARSSWQFAAPSRYSSWLMLRPWVIWVLPEANSSMPSTESTASTGTLWLLVWMDSMAVRQLEVLSMTSWAVTPSGSSWMLGRLYWV